MVSFWFRFKPTPTVFGEGSAELSSGCGFSSFLFLAGKRNTTVFTASQHSTKCALAHLFSSGGSQSPQLAPKHGFLVSAGICRGKR